MATGMNLTDVLNYLADFGVFAYVLPFLLIFAVVFGVLSSKKILGDNKGVHATIAIAVGLLSLQFDYVSEFFAGIFPYAGIGIAVLLVALIFTGIVMSDDGKHGAWIRYVWFVIGAVAFIAIVWASLNEFSFLWGRGIGDFGEIVPIVLILSLLVGGIWWAIKSSGSGGGGGGTPATPV